MSNPDPEIQLTLRTSRVNYLLGLLDERPRRESNETFVDILGQAQAQLQPPAPAPKAAEALPEVERPKLEIPQPSPNS